MHARAASKTVAHNTQLEQAEEVSKCAVLQAEGSGRATHTPGVLTLEGSCIGHNVARRGLVGELHPTHFLDACHTLTCSANTLCVSCVLKRSHM